MQHSALLWGGFGILVLLLLALDLGILHRKSGVLSLREATKWTAGWVALAVAFGAGVFLFMGSTKGLEYFTGYLIELSLSVDNLFVFLLVFQYFAVPARQQPRVLQWGILGALVMRGAMIIGGALLINRFDWVLYIFGVIVVLTGIRMFLSDETHVEPERNPVVKLVRRILPVTEGYQGRRFFVPTREGLRATPLLIVLVVIETTDVVFAVDSIPAIFAVTRDPFIVYTSNVFAILGLRALFFVLAGMLDRFAYLKPAVSAILVFVGAKMLMEEVVDVPIWLSLVVIISVLGGAVALSLLRTRHREEEA